MEHYFDITFTINGELHTANVAYFSNRFEVTPVGVELISKFGITTYHDENDKLYVSPAHPFYYAYHSAVVQELKKHIQQ